MSVDLDTHCVQTAAAACFAGDCVFEMLFWVAGWRKLMCQAHLYIVSHAG